MSGRFDFPRIDPERADLHAASKHDGVKGASPQDLGSHPGEASAGGHNSDSPPGSIKLGEVLDQLRGFLSSFIAFERDSHLVAIVLWIAHSWVFDCFEQTPYLYINSPVKRCGKSRLLKCLGLLCPRPWLVVSPSEAVVYRKIQRDTPTLLLDEVDTIYSTKGGDANEGLRALLNAGYERGLVVSRCVGPNLALADFKVYCPKVLAGIGRLPDTVADRCFTSQCSASCQGSRSRGSLDTK